MERKYEVLYIVRPDVEGGHAGVVGDYQKFLSGSMGSVISIDDWGTRNFAFPVDKYEKGSYVLCTFMMDPANLPELESRFHLDDRVLRHQVIRLDEEPVAAQPES